MASSRRSVRMSPGLITTDALARTRRRRLKPTKVSRPAINHRTCRAALTSTRPRAISRKARSIKDGNGLAVRVPSLTKARRSTAASACPSITTHAIANVLATNRTLAGQNLILLKPTMSKVLSKRSVTRTRLPISSRSTKPKSKPHFTKPQW